VALVRTDELGIMLPLTSNRSSAACMLWECERRGPLGRPRHRWVDSIKMDLLEIGCGGVDWNGVALNRYRWRALVNVVMNFQVMLRNY
jgi:hypothetical protein